MRRVREHVNRSSGCERIIVRAELLQVPGECSGIAGDINNALGRHGQNGFDRLSRQSFSRRIDRDAVRLQAALC